MKQHIRKNNRTSIVKIVMKDAVLKEIRGYIHNAAFEETKFILENGLFSNYKFYGLIPFSKSDIVGEYWASIHTKIPLEYIGKKVSYVQRFHYAHDGLSRIVREELQLKNVRGLFDIPMKLSVVYEELL